jgi:hypothetical protein
MAAIATLPSFASAQNKHVWIRSLSSEPIEAMVSKFSTGVGNDSWFPVPSNYSDRDSALWHRTSWELVAFRDANNQDTRVGFYKDFVANDTFVTFFGFDAVDFSTVNPEL